LWLHSYLSIMDRMGVELDRFGDAETRLVDLSPGSDPRSDPWV